MQNGSGSGTKNGNGTAQETPGPRRIRTTPPPQLIGSIIRRSADKSRLGLVRETVAYAVAEAESGRFAEEMGKASIGECTHALRGGLLLLTEAVFGAGELLRGGGSGDRELAEKALKLMAEKGREARAKYPEYVLVSESAIETAERTLLALETKRALEQSEGEEDFGFLELGIPANNV